MTLFGRSGKRRRSRRRFEEIPTGLSGAQERSGLDEPTQVFESSPSALPDLSQRLQYPASDPFDSSNSLHPIASTSFTDFEEAVLNHNVAHCGDIGHGTFDLLPAASEEEFNVDKSTPIQCSTLQNWRVIWALIMTNGSRKLTKEGYQSIRNLTESFQRSHVISWKSESVRCAATEPLSATRPLSFLPHYTTLQKAYKPYLLNRLAPRSFDCTEPLDTSKAGARTTLQSGIGDFSTKVRFIVPSEYARADISTPSTWGAMCSTSLSSQASNNVLPPFASRTYCVDTLPVIASRDWFYGPQQSMQIDHYNRSEPHTSFGEVGDTVCIHLLQPKEFIEPLKRCFGYEPSGNLCDKLYGVVSHTWNVHHAKRRDEEEFSQDYSYSVPMRDEQIARLLGFRNYTSPNDEGTADDPQLPPEDEDGPESCARDHNDPLYPKKKRRILPEMVAAKKARRDALRRKKLEKEAAWANWKKPLLKPGDFVVTVRPVPSCAGSDSHTLLTQVDRDSRLCIVHRFWTEQEERSRHAFWISGGETLLEFQEDFALVDVPFHLISTPPWTGVTTLHVDVRSIQLLAKHEGKRGPEKVQPISSVGVLDNGENYFIYRFLLFWDGFKMYTGKQASGDGIYMLCLNLPPKARASPSAVRILSLTPPGVKSAFVLNRFIPDIIKGMTEGSSWT